MPRKGVDWGKEKWRRVRLVRKAEEGTIEVYFDDMTKPVLRGKDKTFLTGRVGVGAFDDRGLIDNLRIAAREAETAATKPAFTKPEAKRERRPLE